MYSITAILRWKRKSQKISKWKGKEQTMVIAVFQCHRKLWNKLSKDLIATEDYDTFTRRTWSAGFSWVIRKISSALTTAGSEKRWRNSRHYYYQPGTIKSKRCRKAPRCWYPWFLGCVRFIRWSDRTPWKRYWNTIQNKTLRLHT
jgi:hypothetical protein